MKPEVLIVVSGGTVEDVQANLPGIEVTISDTDQQEVGEPYTSTFEASCVTPNGGQPGTPLTEAELERFDREMQGNFESAKDAVQVLLHLIRIPTKPLANPWPPVKEGMYLDPLRVLHETLTLNG